MLRKGCSLVLQLVLLAVGAGTTAQSVAELLEQGIYAEETVGDLDAAIEIYDRIVNDAQAERPYVARALFRRGQCLLKSGKEDLAIRSFQTLIADYPEQIDLVERLLSAGYAYEVNGSVYFDVSKWSAYGVLSGRDVKEQQAGARVEINPDKKNPADFALWKKADPEHVIKWNSPWGQGYPGWHVECSAMAMKYLGETIDIHGGGLENKFPHHECEIAQSEAARFIDDYFRSYPGVKRFVDGTIVDARERKVSTTMLGRMRRLPDIDSSNQRARAFSERIAVNTPVQGSAADIIKLAMLEVDRRIHERRMASRMILQVHDELLFEVPERELEDMKGLVREAMESAVELDVPLKVDMGVGGNWYEAH